MKSIGYEALDIEKGLFDHVNTELSKTMLKEIVDTASEKIKDAKTPEDILKNIAKVLSELGYGTGTAWNLEERVKARLNSPNQTTRHHPFHESLEKKIFKCRDYMYVYMTIAKENGLPMSSVDVTSSAYAIGHVFIRWYDGSRTINWEPSDGCEYSDSFYANLFGIDERSIRSGCHLRSLSHDESFSILYHALGWFAYERHEYGRALEYYEKAIASNPFNGAAWTSKGAICHKLGDYEEAMRCYEEAVKLDPRDKITLSNIGSVHGHFGRYEEAIKCFDRAIEIAPTDNKPWRLKGKAYEGLGEKEEAKKCFDEANKLGYS